VKLCFTKIQDCKHFLLALWIPCKGCLRRTLTKSNGDAVNRRAGGAVKLKEPSGEPEAHRYVPRQRRNQQNVRLQLK
jgi:hypothetical protein